MWHGFAAEQGNVPGAQRGDVVVTLIQPVGGINEVTVPSNEVAIAAEAGNVNGIQVRLPDGRRMFASWANVAGIIDAPTEAEHRTPAQRRAAAAKAADDK